jgi:hypothetical protein
MSARKRDRVTLALAIVALFSIIYFGVRPAHARELGHVLEGRDDDGNTIVLTQEKPSICKGWRGAFITNGQQMAVGCYTRRNDMVMVAYYELEITRFYPIARFHIETIRDYERR